MSKNKQEKNDRKKCTVRLEVPEDVGLALDICIEVGEDEPPLPLSKEDIVRLFENPLEGFDALVERSRADTGGVRLSASREDDEVPEGDFVDDGYEDDDAYEKDSRQLTTRELGRRGEDAAAHYLELHGMEILDRNWECVFGEADIVALDTDGTLCFIEVKTRRSIAAGLPEEHITVKKRGRYERIAMCYEAEMGFEEEMPVRFDCIAICVVNGHRALLRHHRGWGSVGGHGIV